MSIPTDNAEEKLCRLCSEHCTPHFSLFENKAAQMLDSLTSIKIKSDDPFTTRICLDCFSDLKNAYRIQQKIIENQKKFTEIVNQSNLCVKEEVIDDVCENTSHEDTKLNSLEVVENEVKMEVETSEEQFDSQCSESDNSNLIAETDYGLVEEEDATKENTLTTLPAKSRERYECSYNQFMNWHKEKDLKSPFSERVLMIYFTELATKTAPNTLWTQYSMLRSTLSIYQNIDLRQYLKLRSFLKRKSAGYKPKKSKTLTRQEVNRFLDEAPDDKYLLVKSILIVSLFGACQKNELVQLTIDDVEDLNGAMRIKIPTTSDRNGRTFTITDNFYKILGKYAGLRPPNLVERRFFLNYQNKRCTKQPVGINKIAGTPRQVATYLGLQEPELYTFVSLRLCDMIGLLGGNKSAA